MIEKLEGEYFVDIDEIIELFGEGMFDRGFHELHQAGVDPGALIEVVPGVPRFDSNGLVFPLTIRYDEE